MTCRWAARWCAWFHSPQRTLTNARRWLPCCQRSALGPATTASGSLDRNRRVISRSDDGENPQPDDNGCGFFSLCWKFTGRLKVWELKGGVTFWVGCPDLLWDWFKERLEFVSASFWSWPHIQPYDTLWFPSGGWFQDRDFEVMLRFRFSFEIVTGSLPTHAIGWIW